MSVTINYKSNLIKKSSSNLILFCDEKFNILGLKKHFLGNEFSFVKDLLKTAFKIDLFIHMKYVMFKSSIILRPFVL